MVILQWLILQNILLLLSLIIGVMEILKRKIENVQQQKEGKLCLTRLQHTNCA
jgi:hypothetical protein